MIDFRYHLVSLIAVFLALALGILLGAGPLNRTIGDQLTGQVEVLREDLDRLRTELDVSRTETAHRDAFIDETSTAILGSRLEARTVAVVTLPGAVADDVADVRHRLEQAGATVSGEVAVTEAWTDPATAAFRSSFAGQLLTYLDPAADDSAAPGQILGLALGQGLTRADADGDLGPEAQTLLDLLASASDPLIDLTEAPTAAAHATVLVGPRTHATELEPEQDGGTVDTTEREGRLAVEAALAAGLATTGEGAVLTGSAATQLDLLTVVRSTAPESITTVDSVGDVGGRVSVPMALAATISGTIDHYGFGTDASAEVPPAVYLSPPALPEPLPSGDEDAADAAADGTATDADPAGDGDPADGDPADGDPAGAGESTESTEPETEDAP